MADATPSTLTGPDARFELAEEPVRGEVMTVFRHRQRSLAELFDASRRFGERTYLVDGDVRLTFRGHAEDADALAHGLQEEHGVGAGDRVGIFAANRWEWVVAFWAVVRAGGVPTALNGWWAPAEVRHAVGLTEPVLLIGDGPRLARVAEADVEVPVLRLDEDLPRLLRDHAATAPRPTAVAEDDLAALVFTSGTTGHPKAVAVPHRAMCGFAQVSSYQEWVQRVARGAAPPAAGDELPPSDDVALFTTPLFHLSALYGVALVGLTKGGTSVLLPGRFDPDRVLRTIEAERVTRWSAVGSAGVQVAASKLVAECDTSSMRYVGLGGAPVSPHVQDGLRAAFPSAARSLGMAYTSTEAGAVVATIGGEELETHPTSTGRVTATMQIEIRDALGRPLPDGEEGAIHVRSPYVMLGYWNDPEATAAVLLPGGWLAMGDVGRVEDGLLYINARARDMILVSAENVSPTEVEHRLEAHPGVVEAAVLAVDDPVTGDAVCAVVVVADAHPPTADELATWCRADLAHFKVPTRWHLTGEPLPRTPTGKVVKGEVRRWIGLVSR